MRCCDCHGSAVMFFAFGLQVKLLEVLEGVDREAFEFMFGRELTYTTVLSDQRVVDLIPNGSSTTVRYEDRKEFIRLVQKARLEESKDQVMPPPRAGMAPRDPAPVASPPGMSGVGICENTSPEPTPDGSHGWFPRASASPGAPLWGSAVPALSALCGCPGLRPTVVT